MHEHVSTAPPREDPRERLVARRAAFSQLGVGLGLIPLALFVVVTGIAAWRGSQRVSMMFAALAGPLSVIAARGARRWYQRRGCVGAIPLGEPALAWISWTVLWSLVVFSGTALLIAAFRASSQEMVPLAATFISALSTAALLRRSQLQRGEWFMLGMLAPVAFSSFWTPLSSPSDAKSAFDVGLGVAMAVFGAMQHLVFLRLRRALDEPSRSA